MTTPIQYTVGNAAQAAWIPPQASSADIVALLPHNLKLAPLVVGPQTVMVCWSSWEAAQAALAAGIDPRVGIIGWGVEKNNPAEPLPADEAANIPGWIAQAKLDALAYDRQLAVVPDDGYALQYGRVIAATATVNTVQLQRFQTNARALARTIKAILAAQGNGTSQTFVQTYPGTGLADALAAWGSVADLAGVAGCGFFNSGSDADWAAVQAAIAALRPG